MKRSVIVLLHLAYWFIYTFLFAFVVFAVTIDAKDDHGVPIAYNLLNPVTVSFFICCFFVNSIACFYTAYFVLFQRFFQQKKIVMLIFTGIVTVILSELVSIGLMYLITGHNVIEHMPPGLVLIMGIVPGVHAILGLVMRGFITSYGDIRVKEELRHKNLEMQLALIKTQINPHFLFNTINNIDVLIRKDPNTASDYLNKLSDILRYMLYETKSEKVVFSKEVENIGKYLELQKIRTSNPDYIRFHIKAGSGNQVIAPMLFMPFIENAVKYAGNKKTENAISIIFDANDERITFECRNVYAYNDATQALKGGLGQELARKRLELLYPGKHQLMVNDKDGIYEVILVISLKE